VKIHLTNCGETELTELMRSRATSSRSHTLVSSPGEAELVLMLGSFGLDPEFLLDHTAYREFPDKCAVYTEDDNYLPLAPGVYCSAREDRSTRVGRVFSYTYLSRNGRFRNLFLAEPNRQSWDLIEASAAKRYLFSFQGGSTSLLRKRLFNLRFERGDVLIENTSTYYHWENSPPDPEDRERRQRRYAEVLAGSHFVLCPRGAGRGTIRFFETMAAGVAPVLISDGYVLPPGPDWSQFLIRVKERDIARLPELLEPHVAEAAERGRLARRAFEEHFSMAEEFDSIVALAAKALRHGGSPEASFRRAQQGMVWRERGKRLVRTGARAAALRAMKMLRLRNPYQMNR